MATNSAIAGTIASTVEYVRAMERFCRLRSIKEFTARFKVRMILIFIVCLGSFQTPVMQ